MDEARRRARFRLGWKVMAVLSALTLVEFWIAAVAEGPIPYPALCWPLAPVTWVAVWASANPLPFLGVIALVKGALILHFFMHISQLWRKAEGH